VPTLFRKCPNCGKRFEVRHTAEQVVSRQKEVINVERAQDGIDEGPVGDDEIATVLPDSDAPTPTEIESMVAEHDVYKESYTCKHCGYKWEETRDVLKGEHGGEVRGRLVGEGAP